MPELSPSTRKLLQAYQSWYRSLQPKEGSPTIHVDEVAASVAAFYEKVRGVIDWREEHLLRRASIERILKRRFLVGQNGENLASAFVYELIRGGYFPNDRVEERKIENIQRLFNKYNTILKNSPPPPREKLKLNLYDWLLSLAACETEEILDPPRRERALIEYMEEQMTESIVAPQTITETEKKTQISIAVQKALFKLDNAIISYHLLKKRYPDWLTDHQPDLLEFAKNIYVIWSDIEKDLRHPLAEKFYRICEKNDTFYLIVHDIISQDPLAFEERAYQSETLEKMIREAYSVRLSKMFSRIRRAAFYSTVSIFVTKMVLAFAVEIPFDRYIIQEFSLQTMGLNILIPTFLMFLLTFSVGRPKKSNLEKVLLGAAKLIFSTDRKEIFSLPSPRKRGPVLSAIISFLYLTTFIISFGFIWLFLQAMEFELLSKIIFFVFFSLIAFAGTKLRERAKELSVEEEKGGFFSFLLDSFSLPFIRVGKWLSLQWSKYNIIMVIVTALVDMPFQLFTEFLEQWRGFLKEKREEIH